MNSKAHGGTAAAVNGESGGADVWIKLPLVIVVNSTRALVPQV